MHIFFTLGCHTNWQHCRDKQLSTQLTTTSHLFCHIGPVQQSP